jgi:hypothetical protein
MFGAEKENKHEKWFAGYQSCFVSGLALARAGGKDVRC